MTASAMVSKTPLRQVGSVRELLSNGQARDQLAAVAASHMTPERVMRLLALAIDRTPQIAECSPLSLLGCLMTCAGLALEPNTSLHHAYIIPRKNNKKRVMEATLQIGSRRGVIQFIGDAQEETAKKRGTVRMTRQLARLMRRWAREGGSHVVTWRGEAIEEIDTALLAASRRAGIPPVTPHQLKHTAVSWAFARGMTIEDAVGWFDTSAKTLLGFYREYSPEHQARAQAIMEKRG